MRLSRSGRNKEAEGGSVIKVSHLQRDIEIRGEGTTPSEMFSLTADGRSSDVP